MIKSPELNDKSEFPQRYFGTASQQTEQYTTDEYLNRLPKYRIKHLLRFIQSIPKNGRLLDLGCGKGKTIRLVQAFRPDVKIDACDLTDMTDFLPKGIIFVKCDAGMAIQYFPAGSYDAIVTEHVIEHLVYPTALIEGCYKLLKSGGRVFIETPNWSRLLVPFSPLYFWGDYTHIHPFCRTAFRRMFIEYGFDEEYVKSVTSIDWGRRFFKVRLEDGKVKTGMKTNEKVFKPKDTKLRKLFNAFLDVTLHAILRDILIGVARKP